MVELVDPLSKGEASHNSLRRDHLVARGDRGEGLLQGRRRLRRDGEPLLFRSMGPDQRPAGHVRHGEDGDDDREYSLPATASGHSG